MKNVETENIEHKQSLADWKAIVESVAAFATSSGGVIVVGITPDGMSTGVTIGKGAIEGIANKIKMNTEPAQFPSIKTVTKNKKEFIEIQVDSSHVKPVMAFGKPLKRVGNTNQRIAHHEIKKIIDENEGRFWDSFECRDMTLKDIDRNAIESFLQKARLSGETLTVLKNLRLINNKKAILNGGAVLFAKNACDFYLQSLVKCGRFAGTKALEFIDQKEYESNIFDQLERAQAFIKEHTYEAILITGDLYHQKKPQYPERAIREALVNAFCHRDYTMTSNIQVRIFDGFLEVWSPGLLPDGVSVEMLKGKHESTLRNPKIAAVLHRAGLAEQWGTGTNRMIEECNECGIAVDFENTGLSFIVRFTYQSSKTEKTVKTSFIDEPLQVVQSLLRKGFFSRTEFQEALGLSKTQALRELESLENKGVVKKSGRARRVRYFSVKQ
jgi:ATP-dependent DNA helicase RecG